MAEFISAILLINLFLLGLRKGILRKNRSDSKGKGVEIIISIFQVILIFFPGWRLTRQYFNFAYCDYKILNPPSLCNDGGLSNVVGITLLFH